MPQSSSELRRKWGGEKGVGEDKATEFLVQQGWYEHKVGLWFRPHGKKEKQITADEWEALQFLIEEWDHAYTGRDLPAVGIDKQKQQQEALTKKKA